MGGAGYTGKGREGVGGQPVRHDTKVQISPQLSIPFELYHYLLKYCPVKFLKTIPEAQTVLQDISSETGISPTL